MDSEHRHELKQNDLQEFLQNFGSFWEKHGTWILTVVAIVAVVWAGNTWWRASADAAKEAAWADLALASSPPEFDGVALDHRVPTVRALARLHAGDLYLDQAIHPGRPGTEVIEADVLLDRAQQRYQDVLALDVAPIYHANAWLGLAAVAENREQWDQAQQAYEQAAQINIPSTKAIAKARLELLPQLQRPVVFGEAQPEAAGSRPRLIDLDSLGELDSFDDGEPTFITPGDGAGDTLDVEIDTEVELSP